MDERILPRRKRRLYHIYYGIIARCTKPNNPSYYKYGAKGIGICDEWMSDYSVFEQWAYDNGYQSDLTIDRIDSSQGYCPENCRWTTLSDNSARANLGVHKNKTKLIDPVGVSPDGEIIHITNILQFAKQYGLNYITVVAALHGRAKYIDSGWTFSSNKTI